MASTYLTRTPSSASNRKTFTFSLWFKLSDFSGDLNILSNNGASSTRDYISLESGKLRVASYSGSYVYNLHTNRLFRDTSAWYHLVVAFDTTQGTASNRIKIYVNGVQETSFGTATYPSQNLDTNYNNTTALWISRDYNGVGYFYFNGSMSHVHFCDGTALAPTVFGSTDSTTGEWKINTSPSFTLGTNGFTILKDGNTITDQSTNSNNFSLGGGTLTKTEDNPSNVFATLNPLDKYYGHIALTQGNNTFTQTLSSSSYAFVPSTLGFNSGKWYWEMKCVSGHSDNWYGTGITSSQCTANNNALGNNANDYALYGYSYGGGLASSYTNATRTNQGTTYTAGDILGCAVDCDNLAIYFSKNGVWMSNASNTQGVPTSGGSKTGSFFTIQAPSNTINGFYLPAACYYDARAAVQSFNFGNGYFGTTAVSSAGTNASGNGIFEYDVPTGYTALSTKGLNL